MGTLSLIFRTSVLPSVLINYLYLFFTGELDAAADFLHPNGAAVLDYDTNFAIVHPTDHFDQLLFRLGKYHILIWLHDAIPSSKTKKLRRYYTAAAVFLRNTLSPFAHRTGAKEIVTIPVGLLTCVSDDNPSAFSDFSND